jgi:hypothetical protein
MLGTGTMEIELARWEKLIKEAREHVWVMTPQAMGHLSEVMANKLLEAVNSGQFSVRTFEKKKVICYLEKTLKESFYRLFQ